MQFLTHTQASRGWSMGDTYHPHAVRTAASPCTVTWTHSTILGTGHSASAPAPQLLKSHFWNSLFSICVEPCAGGRYGWQHPSMTGQATTPERAWDLQSKVGKPRSQDGSEEGAGSRCWLPHSASQCPEPEAWRGCDSVRLGEAAQSDGRRVAGREKPFASRPPSWPGVHP